MPVVDITWVDADGQAWDWITGTKGAQLAPTMGGLRLPSWSAQSNQVATQAGRTYLGITYDYRKIPFKLNVGDNHLLTGNHRTGADWIQLDSRVMQSLDPERIGLLVISSPKGVRHLRCRAEEVADASASGKLGHLKGLAAYNVILAADEPWFRGFPFRATLSAATQVKSYNGGELPSWPVWTVQGPATGTSTVTVTAGTAATTLPPVSAGQSLRYNTAPDKRTITDANKVSRRDELTTRAFTAPIPAATRTGPGSLPLSFTYTGSAPTVTVSCPQLYRGAW